MKAFFSIVLCILACTARAIVPEGSKEQLRALVKLPMIEIEAGFGFDPRHGFLMLSERRDLPNQIAEALKQLQENPTAPESYSRLALLHSRLGNAQAARVAFEKAIQLYRARVESQPSNGPLLAEYGQALAGAHQFDKAESVFREAVRVAPDQWKCWVGLGRFLNEKALNTLLQGRPLPADYLPADRLKREISRRKPSPEQAERALRWNREAGECFEQAVASAPDESEPYAQRGMHRAFRELLSAEIQKLGDEETEPGAVTKRMFSEEALADFKQAVRLHPSDPRIVATTAIFEAFVAALQNGAPDGQGVVWTALPESARRSITEAMARLENIGQSAKPAVAANALEALGIIQAMILQDSTGAIGTLRRVVAMDPGREQSWDLLTVLLARPATYPELLAVCQQRVQSRSSTRSQILLAKAYERVGQYAKAEESIQAALRFNGDDFTANVAQAALYLRRGDDAFSLAQAERHLAKADRVSTKTRSQVIDLVLTSSICFALKGEVDKARELVQEVLKTDKENEYAEKILAVLGR